MDSILTLNAGSSSLKFAVFAWRGTVRRFSGSIQRIGLPKPRFNFHHLLAGENGSEQISVRNHREAVAFLIDWLEDRVGFRSIRAAGHRVVHGGHRYRQPQLVTAELLNGLSRISPFDPEHMPFELALIKSLRKKYPALLQVACFDTAFHRDMPRLAQILPIPRRFQAIGVQRYGFHGLSYAFLLQELRRLAGPAAARGRLVLAHLGNGASLAAVRGGKCIDTSMGFTPTSGLVMSTRSGDLDPGLVWYLARRARMSPAQFHQMVNHQSGLLGVSGSSPDMRDLLEREKADAKAAEAVALFCYQAQKWIGGFCAALGGLDSLVFSGGIGENSPEVRARICRGLGFLGIKIDSARNRRHAPVVSRAGSRPIVRVIKTDEELMIARAVRNVAAHRSFGNRASGFPERGGRRGSKLPNLNHSTASRMSEAPPR